MSNILHLDDNGNPLPLLRTDGTVVIVTSTGASAASAAVIDANEDCICRITASADCHMTTGADPTATTSHIRLWANQVEYFIIPKGHKIAIVGASTVNILPSA
jgi:hypothetical protein